MTAEQVEPVTWRISADNPPHALQILQAADGVRAKRLRELNDRPRLDKWPGFQLRVYVENSSRLFMDREHGKAIEDLFERILRDGTRARIRLVVQW